METSGETVAAIAVPLGYVCVLANDQLQWYHIKLAVNVDLNANTAFLNLDQINCLGAQKHWPQEVNSIVFDLQKAYPHICCCLLLKIDQHGRLPLLIQRFPSDFFSTPCQS